MVGRVAQPQILQHTAVAAGKGKRAPEKTGFFGVFPMFVPSLSW